MRPEIFYAAWHRGHRRTGGHGCVIQNQSPRLGPSTNSPPPKNLKKSHGLEMVLTNSDEGLIISKENRKRKAGKNVIERARF